MTKLNLDYLRGKPTDESPATSEDTLSKFKSTAEIFGKSDSAIDTIDCDKLIAYSKHPFTVRDGDRLDELVDSITEQGVLVPLIVRVHREQRGCYEILAGHHRHVAAQRANIYSVPCIIKDVDDNMAALIVVESNKQRGFSDMLPSEIAKALKLEYDALKCQGKRTDLVQELDEILHENNADKADSDGVYSTSCPVVQKLDSSNKSTDNNDMSERNIRRYIRLNYLNEYLLQLVDEGEIAFRAAVTLSYLKDNEQTILQEAIELSACSVDMKTADKLKEYSALKKLIEAMTMHILTGAVFGKKTKKLTAVNLPIKKLKSYMPETLDSAEYEKYILKALEYFRDKERE